MPTTKSPLLSLPGPDPYAPPLRGPAPARLARGAHRTYPPRSRRRCREPTAMASRAPIRRPRRLPTSSTEWSWTLRLTVIASCCVPLPIDLSILCHRSWETSKTWLSPRGHVDVEPCTSGTSITGRRLRIPVRSEGPDSFSKSRQGISTYTALVRE